MEPKFLFQLAIINTIFTLVISYIILNLLKYSEFEPLQELLDYYKSLNINIIPASISIFLITLLSTYVTMYISTMYTSIF